MELLRRNFYLQQIGVPSCRILVQRDMYCHVQNKVQCMFGDNGWNRRQDEGACPFKPLKYIAQYFELNTFFHWQPKSIEHVEIRSCMILLGSTKNKLCHPILEALKSVEVIYVGSKQKLFTTIQSGQNKEKSDHCYMSTLVSQTFIWSMLLQLL